ncbi:hypothetical protein NBRGN_080_00270 [Nocardia brasiliensis NBRC 14402]|nr:hypothetical protein NBRGN_080_00270 [Nocardia brasiliensis NBRC 14402]
MPWAGVGGHAVRATVLQQVDQGKGVHQVTEHLRMRERPDEHQRTPDGRQQDIAARLIRFRLDREPQIVAALAHESGQHIQAFAVTVQCGAHILGTVVLRAFTTAPQHIGARPQFGSQLHISKHLAQREPAHRAIVAGEQVRGHHRHHEPGLPQRLSQVLDPVRTFGSRSLERDQIVIVKTETVRTEFRAPLHRLHRVQLGPGRIPNGSRPRRLYPEATASCNFRR